MSYGAVLHVAMLAGPPLGVDPQSVVSFGPLLVALPIAAAAGLVSFLSPCCLPLLPGYLAYVTGSAGAEAQQASDSDAANSVSGSVAAGVAATGAVSRAGGPAAASGGAVRRPVVSRTVVGTALFVLGFAAVFTSYGAAFGAVGAALLVHQNLITRVLGVVTIGLGLMFAGVLTRIPLAGRSLRIGYRPKAGLLSAPLLGVLFGIGWTPCIGPTLAAVLALSTSTAGAQRGAALSFAYSLGLGIPFLLAAVGAQRAFRLFAVARRHARAVMRIGGGLLVLVGLLEVSGLWAELISRIQVLVANWQAPL